MMRQHELDYAMDWEYHDRFLLIGHELGAYEVPLADFTRNATPALDRCLKQDGLRVVRAAGNLLVSGRACRPEPALFVLGKAIAEGAPRVRREALELIPYACRTGAHLFQLVEYLTARVPFERSIRVAIGNWYSQRTVVELVNLVLRSPQDGPMSHRDLIGIADTKPPTPAHAVFYRWLATDRLSGELLSDPGLELLSAYHLAQTTNSEAVVLALLHRWPALREFLPEPWLTRTAVWRQILPCLSTEALVRWLPRMAEADLLGPNDPVSAMVVQRLQLGALGKGQQAPFTALAALGAVEQAARRQGTEASSAIKDALLGLFHHRLQAMTPTGGTVVIALDPAASTAPDGLPELPGVSPRTALAAFALQAAATAQTVHLLAFGRVLERLDLEPGERIDTLLRKLDAVPHGPSDGATPLDWAVEHGVEADVFLLLNGTRPRKTARPPEPALSQYRARTGRRARWLGVSCGMTRVCEAPPVDLDMVEAHGFDATVPALFLDLIHQEG